MATTDLFEDLWHAINHEVPFNPEAAICAAWLNHYQEWGSPLTDEKPLEGEDGVYQSFARAVVRWAPGGGVEVVTA